MAFPLKICVVCSEEFELKPDKPGYANRCPECSDADAGPPGSKLPTSTGKGKANKEANEARRNAMRELLYNKDN